MLKYMSAAAVAFAMLTAPMAMTANAETKKELSEAQKAAAEHRKQCSEEWKKAKADKTVEKSMTWSKFNGACMKRLSGNT